MDENSRQMQEPGCFRAVLTPHRALGSAGFFSLMGGMTLISFVAGLHFGLRGAWPVTVFFGLDLVILYIAFRLNYRAGRLFETIELTRENLNVRRVHPSGREEHFNFNPYWVRVDLDEGNAGQCALTLQLHGRKLKFGRFLSDGERRDFAGALKLALIDMRGGLRI